MITEKIHILVMEIYLLKNEASGSHASA